MLEKQLPTPSSRSILLVDDDDSLRVAIQKNLEKMGYRVFPAANGKIALELLLKNRVDLVVSDIRMPEMDGLELTAFIKKTMAIPVILITGFSDILEAQEAYKLGAEEFLPKPFEREDLVEAIRKCLEKTPERPKGEGFDYCKIGIEDFISGRQIQFSIFVQISDSRFIKIAHKGEDLSPERIQSYKAKGLHFLYLQLADFQKYVGFNLTLVKAVQGNKTISREKKIGLLRHTGELLLERFHRDGLPKEMFDGSKTFVETTVEVLSEDDAIFSLLDILNTHTDYLYAHSVGVSFYGVLLCRAIDWHLPANKFKVAMGGLLHDVGQKEIDPKVLMRARGEWSVDDVKAYESHPLRSMQILSEIKSIPSDVVQIAKEHHEDALSQGFPSRLKKSMIHPMAKIVAVSDAFCSRVIRNPNSPGVSPHEALQNMSLFCADRLDPTFLKALMGIFKFRPPPGMRSGA